MAKLKNKIAITAWASASSLGHEPDKIWQHYQDDKSNISLSTIGNSKEFVATLEPTTQDEITALKQTHQKYKYLDKSVLQAIFVSRLALSKSQWEKNTVFGINLGSSRGATELFETNYQQFLEKGTTPLLSSPTTTLGNLSSWVATDLQQKEGPVFSHSITCSTSLHAILNAVAWLESGFVSKFLAGGTEAPLTPFTLAQMKALKLYSKENFPYPCKPLHFEKRNNTLVLGEAAAVVCLENKVSNEAIAYIEGIGYATEIQTHNTSITDEGDCFIKTMQMALEGTPLSKVDVIVMHAPGTVKGDLSEYQAIKTVFVDKTPFLTSTKWKTGHSFGASGVLSIELALLMMQHQKAIATPFYENKTTPKKINKVLINAVGFGGNAVSILLGLP